MFPRLAVSLVIVVGLVLFALVSSGCVDTASQEEDPTADVDWTNPIDGIAVASISEAQPYFGFEIYDPALEGSRTIFISDPETTAVGDRVIAFLYTTPKTVLAIQEHFPDMPVANYYEDNDRLVADVEGHGSFRQVILSDGGRAYMSVSPSGAHAEIWWLRSGKFEISIRGPALTTSQAIALANLVSSTR
jgi:hypothetical protein